MDSNFTVPISGTSTGGRPPVSSGVDGSTTFTSLTVGDYKFPSAIGLTGQILIADPVSNPKKLDWGNGGTSSTILSSGPINMGSTDNTLTLTASQGVKFESGIEFKYENITTGGPNIVLSDDQYFVEISDDSITSVTLPDIIPSTSGKMYVISKNNNVLITINKTGNDTIDGEVSYTLNNENERVKLLSNGLNKWLVI